jgi:hypothetical protein
MDKCGKWRGDYEVQEEQSWVDTHDSGGEEGSRLFSLKIDFHYETGTEI